QVPLTMPASERIEFATRPSFTARMSGMPPATAASNASVTPRRRASSYSSAPWCASSALLAVTTCLPAASARRMKVRAGSRPPTSSMTICTRGSLKTFAASPVIGSADRSRPSRGRMRSVSAIAASVSRQPARSSRRCRCAARIFTTPAPTVPRPSRPMRTSSTDVTACSFERSAVDVLEAAERLLDSLLVLDEGEAHVALAVLAKADARGHRHLRFLDAELRELQGAHGPERLGDRRPHEHRALRLGHLPAELVEPVHEHVATLAVDLDDLFHHLLVPLERDDARDLDGLEGAIVEIRLDARERGDHAGIAAHEAHSPARHVVRLRQREDLDANLLGTRHAEARGRRVAVEGEVGVGEVVDDHHAMVPREVHHLHEEVAVHAHRRRVVREG